MKRMYRFKSIKIIPPRAGEPSREPHNKAAVPPTAAVEMSYDLESVRDHVMEVRPIQLIRSRSWISGFFIALLIVIPLFGLIYAILAIGMKIDLGAAGGFAGRLYIILLLMAFILCWLIPGFPAAVRRLKWEFVIGERGAGNWRIVDDVKWGRFEKMLRMVRERQDKEKEKEYELKSFRSSL